MNNDDHPYLSDEADVPEEVRRVINNGFHEHHPFKSGGAIGDFVGIYHEIRSLPERDFELCLEAILRLVARVEQPSCAGCLGKGLAYVKLLTRGKGPPELYQQAADKYLRFATARNWSQDFEETVGKLLGVPYQPLPAEPLNLIAWRWPSDPDPMRRIFSCARPGRMLGSRASVPDRVVRRWRQGLPRAERFAIISLLGTKPDGTDEYSFYSFPDAEGFECFLNGQSGSSSSRFEVFSFRTTDYGPVAPEIATAAKVLVQERLARGRTVLIMDSAGIQRSRILCRMLGLTQKAASDQV